MFNPTDAVDLTSEEIEKSWARFNFCESEKDHNWKVEPEDSVFYKRCSNCGGAEGIRFPKGFM